MPKKHTPVIFISYSSKDRADALRIREALVADNIVAWLDYENIEVGQSFSDAIQAALNEADYYLLLISENSNNSTWVQREISMAFEQAQKRNLPVIPFLLSQADVPLAFKGLIYIDGTKSLENGLDQLKTFFRRHASKVSDLVPQETPPGWLGQEKIQKQEKQSYDPQKKPQEQHQEQIQRQQRAPTTKCHETLGELELGDLRFELSAKLTLKDIRVLWFDVFSTKMEDDVFSQDRATCCLELLDRSSREDRLTKVIDKVCRNYPTITKGL